MKPGISCDSDHAYCVKYLQTKTKFYEVKTNTNFHSDKIQKKKFPNAFVCR